MTANRFKWSLLSLQLEAQDSDRVFSTVSKYILCVSVMYTAYLFIPRLYLLIPFSHRELDPVPAITAENIGAFSINNELQIHQI